MSILIIVIFLKIEYFFKMIPKIKIETFLIKKKNCNKYRQKNKIIKIYFFK